jgi:hypothetical protein
MARTPAAENKSDTPADEAKAGESAEESTASAAPALSREQLAARGHTLPRHMFRARHPADAIGEPAPELRPAVESDRE